MAAPIFFQSSDEWKPKGEIGKGQKIETPKTVPGQTWQSRNSNMATHTPFRSFDELKRSLVEIGNDQKMETPNTELGQALQTEALKTELEVMKKENAKLMSTVQPVMSEVENLRRRVDELAAKEGAERGSDEWADDGWSIPKTPRTGETYCDWGGGYEDYLNGSEMGGCEDENENCDENTPEESGEVEEESGNDGNDDAHGDGQRDEWGNEQHDEWGNEQYDDWGNDPQTTVPDDNECDDGAEEHWADPYTPSTFYRRLNMLSSHQISLPRLDQIEDFDNWDRALRDICKYLELSDALDGYTNYCKDDSERDEEHDWLEFLVSQSLSTQFKRMLENDVPGASVSGKYAYLKEKLAEKRRLRRSQLLTQLDKLSQATSGDNAPEYLEQFLSIRNKMLNLGEDGRVSESAIFGRFYKGLRGQAFTYLVQYQMYQTMKGESASILSFANYAGHLLHGAGTLPQAYY